MATPKTIVEHFVLVKWKEGVEPEKITALESALGELKTIEGVITLRGGAATVVRGDEKWDHILHIRFSSKAALEAYTTNAKQIEIAQTHSHPNVADILILEYESQEYGTLEVSKYGAGHLAYAKLKDNSSKEDVENLIPKSTKVVEMFSKYISQMTAGPNFSARAKGSSFGAAMFFSSKTELDGLASDADYQALPKPVELMEAYTVVDWVNKL